MLPMNSNNNLLSRNNQTGHYLFIVDIAFNFFICLGE